MRNKAGQIAQWTLVAGAVACIFLFAGLIESRPSITYTLPGDEEVVVGCSNAGWGFPERNELPVGEAESTDSYGYYVVEGKDAHDKVQREARSIPSERSSDEEDAPEREYVNSTAIAGDCIRANDQRQHQLMWTGFAGVLLAMAGGYVDLRRRIDSTVG